MVHIRISISFKTTYIRRKLLSTAILLEFNILLQDHSFHLLSGGLLLDLRHNIKIFAKLNFLELRFFFKL